MRRRIQSEQPPTAHKRHQRKDRRSAEHRGDRPTGDDQQRHQRRPHCQSRHRYALGHTEDPPDDLGWDGALQQRPAGQVEQGTATSDDRQQRDRHAGGGRECSQRECRANQNHTAEDRRHQAAPPYQGHAGQAGEDTPDAVGHIEVADPALAAVKHLHREHDK